ncbi:hypothetical protein NL64_06435 [Pseudomonas fluorescens]|uniref:hypothetical protein n=1 Tax=Pseudomonas fluorescens TaxID=294 RepID=UPI00054B35D1|nr:hypothetical protein [Pseudomonas fluorescens]KII34891.1 hypothetical protein NL64_06435 [Pseudomonas fluorescens]
MIDPNNIPGDLVVAVQLLTQVWNDHQVPTGTIIGGFMTVETAQMHAQRRLDKFIAQLEAAGVHIEMAPKEAT